MPPPSPLEPRRTPKQARSRITVDAGLEATLRVLVDEGAGRLTTTRVAERAGVSVGSLYQYFPNKEALVAALVESHVEEELGAVREAVARAGRLPFPEAVKEVIKALVDTHERAPERARAVHAAAVGARAERRLAEGTAEAEREVARFLDARRWRARGDATVAALVVTQAVSALLQRSALRAAPDLDAGRLTEQAVHLVLGYLTAAGWRAR